MALLFGYGRTQSIAYNPEYSAIYENVITVDYI